MGRGKGEPGLYIVFWGLVAMELPLVSSSDVAFLRELELSRMA